MRLPVPRNRIVTLSILAALVTGLVTVGLADPSLLTDTSPADAVTLGGSGGQVTPAADVAPAAADGSTSSTSANEGAAGTPTPNPNFTPAVQSATPSGGEHDWGDHEEEEHEEWDDD